MKTFDATVIVEECGAHDPRLKVTIRMRGKAFIIAGYDMLPQMQTIHCNRRMSFEEWRTELTKPMEPENAGS